MAKVINLMKDKDSMSNKNKASLVKALFGNKVKMPKVKKWAPLKV